MMRFNQKWCASDTLFFATIMVRFLPKWCANGAQRKARKEFSFARKIASTGGSLAITMPPDLAKFYKLKKGENVQLVPAGEHLMKVKV